MAALLILRTVLSQVLRQPLAWLVAAILVTGWWGLEVLMPLGLATDGIHRSSAHYELAFIGGAIAQMLALEPCLKLRWAFLQRGSAWGVAVDVAALFIVALLMGSVIVVPAELFQLWQFAEFHTASSLAALFLGWAHVAAMAAVVPLRSSIRDTRERFQDKLIGVGWIAFAAVVIPALASGLSPHGRALLHLLDPGRMLRATFVGAELGLASWAAALIPIVGWSLVAAGLRPRDTEASSAPSIPPHALRDSRRHSR